MKVWWKSSAIILILFLVIGTVVYWNSLNNPFFYDDEMYVVNNLNIRTLDNLSLFFKKASTLTAKGYPGGHYRPLVVTSYAVNYAIGGLNTAGYHLFNLIFHILSSFLVFLIVKAMLSETPMIRVFTKDNENPPLNKGGPGGVFSGENKARDSVFIAALSAGLIFLVHPFNTEAVNYITARSTVMSGFFFLLAFWCWVKFRSKKQEVRSKKEEARNEQTEARSQTEEVRSQQQEARSQQTEARSKNEEARNEQAEARSKIGEGFSNFLPLTSCFYLCSLSAFIAGMLSKEVAVTLLIIIWLYDIYRIEDAGSQQRGMLSIRSYLPYIPYGLVVIVPYILMRLYYAGSILPGFQRDIFTQLFTEAPVLVKHWQMFIFPYPLTPLHDVAIQKTFFSFQVIASGLLLTVLLIIAFFLLYSSGKRDGKKAKIISFFILWFFVVLLPTTIFPLNLIFQENRGYLAIVSFAVFAGMTIAEVCCRWNKKAGIALLVLLIIIYSVVVVNRNNVWKNELTLWSDVVQKEPKLSIAYTALGVAYRRAGMYHQAINASQKAIEIGGWKDFVVHDNLARSYMELGKWDLAASEFEKAIKIAPNLSVNHIDLGIAYYRIGKYNLAETSYRKAIMLDHENYKPYFNLGILYGTIGKSDEALNAYQKAIDIYPGHLKSWLHIGILLDDMGKKKEASVYFEHVLKNAQKDDGILAKEASRRLLNTGGIRDGG